MFCQKTQKHESALAQHGSHFSSFIEAANKPMNKLRIQDNEMAIKYVQTHAHTVTSNILR